MDEPLYGLNEDGTLDEIFAEATHVHVEQMSDTAWWIGGSYTEDTPGDGLEGGEFSSGVRVPDGPRVKRPRAITDPEEGEK